VTDPIARRCNAFSVGVTVRDEYEIINADRPDFYALIKYAELTEISLTDTPANIHARVHNRMATCARAEFFGHALCR
jgi:phage head maturation protease